MKRNADRSMAAMMRKRVVLLALLLVVQELGEVQSSATESNPTSTDVVQCPDSCRCGLDQRGRVTVVCDQGEMVDPIPVRSMDRSTEVLIISAPRERANSLTIGPIFQEFSQLEELRITNSFIPAIGKNTFWGLRFLRTLSLASNNISALVESNFRALINLQQLSLRDNVIDSIPSAVFRHLSSLKKLDLSSNRISGFVPRLFYGLHKLEQLDLSNNPIVDIDAEVFRDIRLLKSFSCRSCGLTYINRLLLHLLSDLEYLDLGENAFHYVEKDALVDVRQLRYLFLDANFVSVLTAGVLQGKNLTSLSLARNRIITLDPAAFVNVSIGDLDLSYNRIQSLDSDLFMPLSGSLHRLKLAGNPLQISHLWSNAIGPRVGLHLTELDLSDMPLGDDPLFTPDLFSFQEGLRLLNLSGCSLSFLHADSIQAMTLLRQLDLSRNSLTTLPESTLTALSGLTALKQVFLQQNPWHCEACIVGPLLKWLDVTPATRHIKDNCRGLRTNANLTDLRPPQEEPEGVIPCPVCHGPHPISGVELPRLDHINLPPCNSPPALINSGGLPMSKVRLGGSMLPADADLVATGSFLEDPLYIGLAAGLASLILLALCAAVTVATRHAVSYYASEEQRARRASRGRRRPKDSEEELCETKGTFHITTASEESHVTLLENTNLGRLLKCNSASSSGSVSRGVSCKTTSKSDIVSQEELVL